MGLREWALVLMATLQLPISTNEAESAAESLGLIDGVRLKVPKGWANANALESSAAKLRRELASK